MSEMVERVALSLFWRAEHLDPSADGDVPEDEHGNGWPNSLNERKREFWRLLAKEAITSSREPTQAMKTAATDVYTTTHGGTMCEDCAKDYWQAMIYESLK